MKTQKRAKVGGEIGANGEHYKGGRFLNTIPENEKKEGSKAKKARKIEIEPFVWVLTEEGKVSLYRQFAGVFGRIGRDGKAEYFGNDTILAYHGITKEEALDMIARYNAGERFA